MSMMDRGEGESIIACCEVNHNLEKNHEIVYDL